MHDALKPHVLQDSSVAMMMRRLVCAGLDSCSIALLLQLLFGLVHVMMIPGLQ